MALELLLDNPDDVRFQINVFCVFTLYLGKTCCLHLQVNYPALQT